MKLKMNKSKEAFNRVTVFDIQGTTRYLFEGKLNLKELNLSLINTTKINHTSNKIEKAAINKKQIISGVIVLLFLVLIFIMYFVIGLKYTIFTGNSKSNFTFTGFSGVDSLEEFKDTNNTYGISVGKDIYSSALMIIILSIVLLITIITNCFISRNKTILVTGLSIFNYLLILLILILSIVILAEFIQYTNELNNTITGKVANSSLSLTFLVITGIVLPLLTMTALFNKQLFLALWKKLLNY